LVPVCKQEGDKKEDIADEVEDELPVDKPDGSDAEDNALSLNCVRNILEFVLLGLYSAVLAGTSLWFLFHKEI